jgi:hypothetical protein
MYAKVICCARGLIQMFLMDWTGSVHCQYMHKSYAMLWGQYNFFKCTGLDLYIVNICTSHMPRYRADSIFFHRLDSICASSIYAQVICWAIGPIQLFLMARLDLCIVNICTSHIPCHGADSIFFNGPDSVCAL